MLQTHHRQYKHEYINKFAQRSFTVFCIISVLEPLLVRFCSNTFIQWWCTDQSCEGARSNVNNIMMEFGCKLFTQQCYATLEGQHIRNI